MPPDCVTFKGYTARVDDAHTGAEAYVAVANDNFVFQIGQQVRTIAVSEFRSDKICEKDRRRASLVELKPSTRIPIQVRLTKNSFSPSRPMHRTLSP